MDGTDTNTVVNLDELNKKQRSKEYKATLKLLKSKESVNRTIALQKFNLDQRYLLEGSCLIPLIESAFPKKKTLEHTKAALETLTSFVNRQISTESIPNGVAFLSIILEESGNLDVLEIISNLIIAKEELNPKTKKNVDAATKNEDQYPFFRRETLHLIYSIISQLLSTKNVDNKIIQSFVSAQSLLVNLCESLKELVLRYEDESQRLNMIQEGVWNLTSIEYLIRNNPTNNIELFLQQDVIHQLIVLAKEKNFTFYCLHILDLLSENADGLKKLSESETMDLNYDLIESAVTQLITKPINISNTPVAKEKADKSKKKTSSKDDSSTVGKEIPMYNNTDPEKLSVIYLKLIVMFLTKVARQIGGDAFSQHSVERMVEFLSKAMLESKVWEIARSESDNPNIALDDLIESICILFGYLGQIGSNTGIAAAKAGAAKSLLSIMQVSRAVFGLPLLQPLEPLQMDKTSKVDKSTKEKGTPRVDKTPRDSVSGELSLFEDDVTKLARVLNLRKISEKAILHLATYPLSTIDSNRDHHSSNNTTGSQASWESCSYYQTNTDLCIAPVSGGSTPSVAAVIEKGNPRKTSTPLEMPPPPLAPVSITSILDLITNIDSDLSDRGIKLLAAIMQGARDSVTFNKTTGLENATVVTKLASVVERCGAGMLAYADSLTSHLIMRSLSVPLGQGSPGKDTDDISVVSQVVHPPPPDVPAGAEYFALSLMCIEPLVALSAESVNAFSTEAILSILAGVLYRCGPSGSYSAKTSNGGSSMDIEELKVELHDPRDASWQNDATTSSTGNNIMPKGSTIKLRHLILNLLTKVLSTDSIFRVYEGEVNVEPGNPAPDSTSPTSEATGLIFKLCSDPVVGILLTDTMFVEKTSVLSTLPSEEKRIGKDVLDASLEFLLALTSNGLRGVALALESIASPKLLSVDSAEEKKKLGSLTGLKDFLYYVEEDGTASDSIGAGGKMGENVTVGLPGGKSNLSLAHTWKYPQYFDQIIANGSTKAITTCNHILETPLLWPIVTVCGGVLGIVGNPRMDSSTAELALKLLNSLIFYKMYQVPNQPALYDIFSAVFLSMGGGVTLASAVGMFGILRGNSLGLETLHYLFGRGASREQFWKKWALAKAVAEAPVIDKKGGKAVTKAVRESVGKDKIKDKSKGGKGGKSALVADEDFSNPYEPDDIHPDPNHGPDTLFWKNLLCIPFDDLNSRSLGVFPLSCCLQAGLCDCVLQLIEVGVSVNELDGCGMAPLMYALLLGDELVINSLIQAGADLDALDGSGNPAVKYAFFSISTSLSLLNNDTSFDTEHWLSVNEEPSLLGVLIDAGVDLVVCDAHGSNPLHFALGLETLRARLGGKNIVVKRDAYSCATFRETTFKVVKSLVESGANVNVCNKAGMIPLHIAAAYCDYPLMELLLQHGTPETSNTLDTAGFLPIHYAFAGCLSDDCFLVVKLLLERGGGRALYPSVFCDGRTGKSKLDKYLTEVEAVLTLVLGEALCPAAIIGKRLSVTELLQVRTRTDLNCFHLIFGGGQLSGVSLLKEIASQVPESGSNARRIAIARQLVQLVESEGESSVTGVDMLGTLMQQVDQEGFTMLHALSLLEGTATGYAELLQSILQFNDVNNLPLCSHDIAAIHLPIPWTPLHAALANDNKLLVQTLLTHGADIGAFNYIHFLSVCKVSESVASIVIQAAASDVNYQQLLNGERNAADTRDKGWGSPLHLAVRMENNNVIQSLMHCSKVNPMVKDSDTGESPLMECCRQGRVDLVEALAIDKDRLDLLAQDHERKNSIDVTLEQQNVLLLETLIRMRRNDVVEYVLSKGEGKETTILKRLELENIALAEKCGVGPVSVPLISGSLPDQPSLSLIESDEIVLEGQPTRQSKNLDDDDVSVTLDDEVGGETLDNSLVGIDALKLKLETSNNILQLLLSAIMEVTHVMDKSAHAHECFASGKLYGYL